MALTHRAASSGVVGLLIMVHSSDHRRERSLHTVLGLALGVVGIVVMAASRHPAALWIHPRVHGCCVHWRPANCHLARW